MTWQVVYVLFMFVSLCCGGAWGAWCAKSRNSEHLFWRGAIALGVVHAVVSFIILM
jgi:hypothetical protein